MRTGNQYTKEEKANLRNIFVFFKNNFSQSNESHLLQNEIIKQVHLFSKKRHLRPVVIQIMSYVYKKTLKIDENQKLVYFFAKNRCRSQQIHNEILLKNNRFCTNSPYLDANNAIYLLYLTRVVTK